jgi:hypothetical protein
MYTIFTMELSFVFGLGCMHICLLNHESSLPCWKCCCSINIVALGTNNTIVPGTGTSMWRHRSCPKPTAEHGSRLYCAEMFWVSLAMRSSTVDCSPCTSTCTCNVVNSTSYTSTPSTRHYCVRNPLPSTPVHVVIFELLVYAYLFRLMVLYCPMEYLHCTTNTTFLSTPVQ